jgi:hypothetical protein
MTLLRRLWDAVVSLDPNAADRDESRSRPYCTPEELEGLWREAGLRDPATTTVVVTPAYDGFVDLWRSLEQGSGPSSAYVASLGPDAREHLRDELRHRLDVGTGPFRRAAGRSRTAGCPGSAGTRARTRRPPRG